MIPNDALAKAHRIATAFLRCDPGCGRNLIAIAGPPAAGKSTVAQCVCEALEKRGYLVGLVPMDGYHMDNDTLRSRGLLSRKGAPETFELTAFRDVVHRLKTEPVVNIALFDRGLDATVPDAMTVSAQQKIVVVEGNYLLFDAWGWRDLKASWDFSVFIEEDLPILEDRLIARWLDHGLAPQAAIARAHSNDIPNAKRVLSQRLAASLCLSPERAGSPTD